MIMITSNLPTIDQHHHAKADLYTLVIAVIIIVIAVITVINVITVITAITAITFLLILFLTSRVPTGSTVLLHDVQ